MLETTTTDVRYALRSLAKHPGFTATALVTLALGIGATATMFSVVNGVLLKPLPFDTPDELVAVWHSVPKRGSGRYPMSPGTYFTYREENRVFEDIGLWSMAYVTVTGLDEPEYVRAMQVTDGTFPLLRVEPALGRRFTAADDTPGTPRTVMLDHSYWRQRFGSDPDVIGRTLTLNGVSFEIIGVLPRGFLFLGHDAAVYFPLRFDRSRASVGNFSFPGVARLRPGVTLEQANRDVGRMLFVAPERFSRGPRIAELREAGFGPDVHPLKSDAIRNVGTVIWVLFATVGLVLAIACVNVANLFLVRAETRQREIAVRAALGAGRSRLARQFLAESLVLGLGGGVIGLGAAFGGIRILARLAPDTLPRVEEIAIDPLVLLFTLAIALLAGLVFGLFPLLRFGSPNLVNGLKAGGHGSGHARERHRLRNVLAAAEVALALVVLIGSGLMARSFIALTNVYPGFDRPEDVLTFRIVIPSAEVPDAVDAARMHETLLRLVAELPDVVSAAASSSITMDGNTSNNGVDVEAFPTPDNQLAPLRRYKWVAGDYFATMGNPILAGRAITWDDIRHRAPVAVITENFAREYWSEPSQALGNRISDQGENHWHEIIGVVGNARDNGIDQQPPTIVYWPFVIADFWGSTPFVSRALSYVIRAGHADPARLLPRIREVVRSVNPNLPLAKVQTLDEILSASMARTSFTLVMLAIASAVALLLGVVGVYGVISYVVEQRTREIGVRVALGARQSTVRLLVLRQGGLIAVAGITAGLVGAAGLTRFVAALLFGVEAADPMTFGASAALVGLVTLIATYLPARRAAAVDPVQTLRVE